MSSHCLCSSVVLSPHHGSTKNRNQHLFNLSNDRKEGNELQYLAASGLCRSRTFPASLVQIPSTSALLSRANQPSYIWNRGRRREDELKIISRDFQTRAQNVNFAGCVAAVEVRWSSGGASGKGDRGFFPRDVFWGFLFTSNFKELRNEMISGRKLIRC